MGGRTLLLVTAISLVAACAEDTAEVSLTFPATTGTTTTSPATTDEVFTPDAANTPTTLTTPASATTANPTSTISPTTTANSTINPTTSTTTPSTTTTSTTTMPAPATSPCPPTGAAVWENRPASPLVPPEPGDGWTTQSIGTSVLGRDITAVIRTVENPGRRVIVIGGIHGNEPASAPSVRAMVGAGVPDDLELWLVPLLNPDGSAAGTRCNANGVDLNRNFSWDWRPSTGGPGPFSEPEPRAARDLVERLQPDLVIWVHQPLDYVSSIGATPDVYEAAWSAGSGLPVRPDVTQHGGGESWTAFVAGVPSMLIEMAGWDATQAMVDAQVAGLDALLAVVTPD